MVFPAYPITPYPPLLVNAALTGMVGTVEKIPALPVTPERIVADAVACHAAGASIVHLHARDGQQRPVWQREASAELIGEIRRRAPGLVVCVTTSGRADPDVDRRADVLELDGELRPDMASLTLGSLNFGTGPSVTSMDTVRELARRMRDRGIKPELEIFDLGMAHLAHRLLDEGLLHAPLYANLMLGFPNGAPADAATLAALVAALPAGTVWAGAGLGAYQRPVTVLAAAMGGHVRAGLEDNAHADHRTREPATNELLVRRAAEAGALVGRATAAPDEARALLGLGGSAASRAAAPAGARAAGVAMGR